MKILEEEVYRIDLNELVSKINGNTVTEQFKNLIPEAMKLSHHDDEKRMILATRALIKYYGKESEIGINITEEMDVSIDYIENHDNSVDLRDLAIHLYLHCNDPHFLIPLWFINK